jgi:hypothetical protein
MVAGVVSGITPGIDTVVYTYGNTCDSYAVTKGVVVATVPVIPPITGSSTFCIGTVATNSDSLGGGAWSASTNLNINADLGLALGGIAGIDTVYYMVANNCGSSKTSTTVTLDSPQTALISCVSYVCIGMEDTLAVYPPGGVLAENNDSAFWVSPFTLKGMEPGLDTVTYRYTNACGTSAASVVIQVYGKGTCDSLNGVQEIGINPGGLTINPNPSTGVYNMTLSTPGRHIAVRVTDLLGNTLMETAYDDAAAWSIDLHGQAGGVYMVTVTVDGVSYFGKLVLW